MARHVIAVGISRPPWKSQQLVDFVSERLFLVILAISDFHLSFPSVGWVRGGKTGRDV